MKKILLKDATKEQMMAFAETTLGISSPANIGVDTLRAKIQAAWTHDEITVDDSAPAKPMEGTAPHPATAAQAGPERKMVRVIIHKTDEPGGDEPVPVGVNGRVMLVPRGKQVDIPEDYFHVLSNASRLHYDTDGNGSLIYPPREIHQYPHQRVA